MKKLSLTLMMILGMCVRSGSLFCAPAYSEKARPPIAAPKAEAEPESARKKAAPAVTFNDEEERTITLPPSTVDIGPGPNHAAFDAACLTCHSPKYVSMQPKFPRKVWEAEVKKMIKVFGAPIQEAQITPIVEYLTVIRGAEEKPAAK
jgi:hypothetical protein